MRFQLAPRLMTLNCYKFKFSENFAGFCRFERQQLLNEDVSGAFIHALLSCSYLALARLSCLLIQNPDALNNTDTCIPTVVMSSSFCHILLAAPL